MCRLVLVTVAIAAILFGISGLYMIPKLVQQKIEQRMQLKIGTKTFDRFTNIPIPLTVKFYFFNVTNSDQVLAGLERPKFQEIGPFMFKQRRRREIIDIIDHNRKITYKEIKTFFSIYPEELRNSTSFVYYDLEKDKIIGQDIPMEQQQQQQQVSMMTLEQLNENNQGNKSIKEEENINNNKNPKVIKMLNPYKHNLTLVNLPLLSVLTQLAELDESSLKRSLFTRIVTRLIASGKEKILINKAANEFLFDGYKVGLMDATTDLVSNTLGFNFDSPLPRNKFGFFHGKNNTWSRREAGEMTIFTGRNNSMDDFMLVDNWNGLKSLSVWPKTSEAGNRCNEIRGTDGSQFHPGVTRQQVLNIFSPMICTSIFVKYKQDTSVRDIPLLRFTTPPEVFAAPKKHGQNSCYCTIRQEHHSQGSVFSQTLAQQQQQNNGKTTSSSSSGGKAKLTNARCYLDGLMDLSLCQKGAPVAASAPHFYNSDPMLSMAAGLEPRREVHETYLDIEPMTGAVMRAASRAQLNAFVERAALEAVDSDLIGHMTPMVAPLIWFEESAQIDEKSSAEFKGQLLSVIQKAKRTFAISIISGIILLALVSIHFWYVTCYKIGPVSKRQPDLEEQIDNSSTSRRRARNQKEKELRQASSSKQKRRLTGARRANLVRQPLMVEDAKNSASSGNGQSSVQVAAAAIGVAAVLGAADAAATSNKNNNNNSRRSRGAERRARRRADYEQDDDDDDETLSLRALVTNEWPAPGKGNNLGTPEATSSSPASTIGGGGAPVETTRSSETSDE